MREKYIELEDGVVDPVSIQFVKRGADGNAVVHFEKSFLESSESYESVAGKFRQWSSARWDGESVKGIIVEVFSSYGYILFEQLYEPEDLELFKTGLEAAHQRLEPLDEEVGVKARKTVEWLIKLLDDHAKALEEASPKKQEESS